MKVTVFHPESLVVAWSMGAGISATLRRMGHSVTDVVMPTAREASKEMFEQLKRGKPSLEELKSQDFIIVSGPEHILPWIEAVYSKDAWSKLSVPKAAWLHESCRREDCQIDIDNLKWVADHFFFAGIQDAEFHDQEPFLPGRAHWLPLGVDTEMFNKTKFRPGSVADSMLAGDKKEFDIAFIGLLYSKRQIYLNALARHQIPPIRHGQVVIQDLHGFDAEASTRRLAANYRSVKVFFNLPALSNMLVSKVYEVMACGTFLLTPSLPEDGLKNMSLFESGKHLIYYKPSNLPYVAQLLREWSSSEKDAERQAIAEAGCREVHEKHSLRVRLEQMIIEAKISLDAPIYGTIEIGGVQHVSVEQRVIPASPAQIKAYKELSKG